MQIAEKCVVSIQYKLSDDEGEVLDSSEDGEPLVYLHGADNIIPGLEKELTGKQVGDSLKVTIQPEEGYGAVNEEMIQTVERSAFEGVDKIEPGMRFEAAGEEEGETQLIVVVEVTDDEVTVDGNHPLAGEVLHFEVTVDEVREATEEELTHGHAHGPGGHHHH
ncbi:MAG: peptidylprolyl isomerase [Gemmatimonadetes bacterium]|nr:peptidylprolyl isomerase [Gemmatimonadota bacterium]MBT5055872.1 peptidylprolyl isomerase [Gemmatimonadota bacterium]MBT5144774.1 peptidylprolyl isomerase [Gemmatimonadota bacterium]MBT5592150.1 peptidylprolyl isomerase [Gemmatimonadota bacterium]MBT5964897.1 peptidylprolyl isomerase [Gemmatimonadota bacterium]